MGAPSGLPAARAARPATTASTSLDEIEALRDALRETGNISSAVDVARRRGRGPASPARLLAAFDRFDEAAADRELEESLAVRSVERTVEEVLLPALELAAARDAGEAELEHASRWAVGWLHSARRLAPPATRPEGVLLLDSGASVGPEAVETQALELFLRRAGLRVLLLSAELRRGPLRAVPSAPSSPGRPCSAAREARLDVLGAHLRQLLSEGAGARASTATGRPASSPAARGLPSLGTPPARPPPRSGRRRLPRLGASTATKLRHPCAGAGARFASVLRILRKFRARTYALPDRLSRPPCYLGSR